jgi:hypothetical protein
VCRGDDSNELECCNNGKRKSGEHDGDPTGTHDPSAFFEQAGMCCRTAFFDGKNKADSTVRTG